MKLYCDPANAPTRPILLLAAEVDIPLDVRSADAYTSAHRGTYMATIVANRSMPILVDGTLHLARCSTILKYLAEIYDAPSYPYAPLARARIHALMDWCDADFHREFGYGLISPQALPQHAWPDGMLARSAYAKAERATYSTLSISTGSPARGPVLVATPPPRSPT